MYDGLRTFSHLGVLSDGFYSETYSVATSDLEHIREKWITQGRTCDELRDEISCAAIFGKSLERAIIENRPFIFYDECNKARGYNPGSLAQIACEMLFNPEGFRRKDVDSYVQAYSYRFLRQISLAFSKVETIQPATGDEVEAFVTRVMRSPDLYAMYANPLVGFRQVVTIARILLRRVLLSDDGSELAATLHQWTEDPYGLHGPGAVSGGEVGREKWDLELHPRIPEGIADGQIDALSTVYPSAGGELTSRLALVPKDIKRNRLICIEPKELMFAQQGLMKALCTLLESHPLTRDSICFHDQDQQFWRSRQDRFSTIDLEDASDLVSMKLLKLLLPKKVAALLLRFRSSAIELPDGRILRGHQTAFTMGNALCFPTETLIFWALATAACIADDLRVNELDSVDVVDFDKLSGRYRCYVFGDDIIAPVHRFEAVIEALQQAGLVVNRKKSCGPWTPVRESCGSYWWGNHDVRIVRFTTHLVDNHDHAFAVWQYCQTFSAYGFPNVAEALLDLVKDVIPNCKFDPESIRSCLGSGHMRWNAKLQRLEARVVVPRGVDRRERLPGDVSLYAYFTGQATQTVLAGRTRRPVARWVPLSELPRI